MNPPEKNLPSGEVCCIRCRRERVYDPDIVRRWCRCFMDHAWSAPIPTRAEWREDEYYVERLKRHDKWME